MMIEVEMEVSVRKYKVDEHRLKKCLCEHKAMTTSEIAERLGVPKTMAEHWFRRDNFFAIPDPEIWFDLKKLLGIDTDEFDQAITIFETKGGNYDMRNRIYCGDVAPTLTVECGNQLYLLGDIV